MCIYKYIHNCLNAIKTQTVRKDFFCVSMEEEHINLPVIAFTSQALTFNHSLESFFSRSLRCKKRREQEDDDDVWRSHCAFIFYVCWIQKKKKIKYENEARLKPIFMLKWIINQKSCFYLFLVVPTYANKNSFGKIFFHNRNQNMLEFWGANVNGAYQMCMGKFYVFGSHHWLACKLFDRDGRGGWWGKLRCNVIFFKWFNHLHLGVLGIYFLHEREKF